jgi:hypothetical protein
MAIFFATIHLLNARRQRNFQAASEAIKISERDGGYIQRKYNNTPRFIEGPSAKTEYLQFWLKFCVFFFFVRLLALWPLLAYCASLG